MHLDLKNTSRTGLLDYLTAQVDTFYPDRKGDVRRTLDGGLDEALASAKDYIAIEDVTRALRRIALSGRHRLYNVAAGQNVTNAAIAAELQRLCGCAVDVPPDAPVHAFPEIDTTRLAAEFTPPDAPLAPAGVLGRLPDIVNQVRRQRAVATGASA